MKQQLINPLIQRLQLIKEKLNNIIDPVEIETLTQKKAVTQEELDRVADLEDLEDLMEGWEYVIQKGASWAIGIIKKYKYMSGLFPEFTDDEYTRRIDWLKISSIDLNGAHSAIHCELRWETYAHPRFVKTSFTVEEDKLLIILAKNHEFR